MESMGFKELYEVSLKATYPIEVGSRVIEVGENIAVFDRIQLANFEEIKSHIAARGGKHNPAWVWWEETKEVRLRFNQGVFSQDQLSIMWNANLIKKILPERILIPKRERLESDELGYVELQYRPYQEKVFIYLLSGEKITEYLLTDQKIHINEPYTDIIVDYEFEYDGNTQILQIGEQLTNGFLSLCGKIKVKNDTDGKITTGIIRIPKLKLITKMSMQLGNGTIPILASAEGVAFPTGVKGDKKVMEIEFLSDDIDSDM